jgi:hypothetical protein
MRKLLFALSLLSLVAVAPKAHAGFTIEGSVGKPYQLTSPGDGFQPTNIMIAPGYEVLEMVRFQLGFAAQLADVEGYKAAWQLRPSVGLFPPILPLFARATFALENIGNDTHTALGLSGGVKLSLLGLGVFLEAGYLPTFASKTYQAIEGRAGAYFGF